MTLLNEIRSNAVTDYAAFLGDHADSISVGDFALLYGHSDIEERNATYEVHAYVAGWVAIGDDGGGSAFLMRLDGSETVFRCGHGAIGSIAPEIVSGSFRTWLADECPMTDDDDFGDD